MVSENKRAAILTLYEEGKKKKEIARLFGIEPKTVRKIIAGKGKIASQQRSDKKSIDTDLLRKIYSRCDGHMYRVYEIMAEEHGFDGGYSTLTRMIRVMGIGQKVNKRCHHVPDIPGAEMQHDTSPYTIKIGGRPVSVICSGLYLRYCKMRYIKFYPSFNRFKMKCFFYEALTHLGYSADTCVIDNTNLAILHGTGKDAVFNPEMISFAKPYGFSWLAHEKGHSNRKAGKERNFWTIETNFFPGRTFESIEDLNSQGFSWATERYARRPQSKTRLIPTMLLEEEKADLIKLPAYIEPPYQIHQRHTDQYGYIAFNGNYYWIPGKSRENVKIIEYSDSIEIYQGHEQSVRYCLPGWKVKNKKFSPQGVNTNPYEPNDIKKTCHEEEKRLRDKGDVYSDYLDFIKSKQSRVKQKAKFIRDLYCLSKKMADTLFMAVIERALQYRVSSINTLSAISCQLMKKGLYDTPDIPTTHDYEQREAYQQGRFSQEGKLTYYQKLLSEAEDNENSKED